MIAFRTGVLIVLLAWALLAGSQARSCPFCPKEKPPLLAEFNRAQLVLTGAFTNARLAENTTDFVIDQVLKPHDCLKNKVKTVEGKQVLPISRLIKGTMPALIFCDVLKDQVQPYYLMKLQAGLLPYLKGALRLKDRPTGERLRYCFDHLNSDTFEVSMDAFREFARADYKDYMEMAKKLPPDTIAQWLQARETPPYRHGLYASLLGHCGKAQHAALLRSMIDDPEKRRGIGLDGMLAGYPMIQPKEAWAYYVRLLKDRDQDFLLHHALLRTIGFLLENRPDILPRQDLVNGMCLLLEREELADFAIDYLRKCKCWEATDQVLDLFGKKSHDVPMVRRAILRFALVCPLPKAEAFVQEQRRRNGVWVKETEEILKFEQLEK